MNLTLYDRLQSSRSNRSLITKGERKTVDRHPWLAMMDPMFYLKLKT